MKNYAILFSLLILPIFLIAQTAPTQPAGGPAGSNYVHASYDSSFYGADITDQYWLFEPNSPKPDSAPVILLFHGGAQTPDSMAVINGHLGIMQHLAKKGYTVVYPLYQYGGNNLPGYSMTVNAAAVVNLALTELNTGTHVKIKEHANGAPMVSVAGHSRGGKMSLDMTNDYLSLNLPKLDAMADFMGSAAHASMSDVPTDTKVLIVRAEHDAYVDVTLEKIESTWDSLAHVPCENKQYLQVNSDSFGTPELTADHFFMFSNVSPSEINSLDYFASWKLLTGLLNCTYYGTDCEFWKTDQDTLTYMGLWSDGTPVNPITVVDPCVTSVEKTSQALNINIYPNPFSDKFSISSDADGVLVLFNSLGQTLLSKDVYQGYIEVELPRYLKRGMYFYQFLDKGSNPLSGKLLKQ